MKFLSIPLFLVIGSFLFGQTQDNKMTKFELFDYSVMTLADAKAKSEKNEKFLSVDVDGISNDDLNFIIDQYGHILKLTVFESEINIIPTSINKLDKLLYLQFDQTKIRQIPPELGNMILLKDLVVANSQLEEIPASINSLVDLEELSFYNNQISSLPENLGNLSLLRFVNLSHNEISSIPESVNCWINIVELDIRKNKLEVLPESLFSKMKKLTKLFLSANKLSSLPLSMNELESLEVLNLAFNPIETIPHSILALPNLKVIDITGTNISEAELEELSKINNQVVFKKS